MENVCHMGRLCSSLFFRIWWMIPVLVMLACSLKYHQTAGNNIPADCSTFYLPSRNNSKHSLAVCLWHIFCCLSFLSAFFSSLFSYFMAHFHFLLIRFLYENLTYPLSCYPMTTHGYREPFLKKCCRRQRIHHLLCLVPCMASTVIQPGNRADSFIERFPVSPRPVPVPVLSFRSVFSGKVRGNAGSIPGICLGRL